MTAPTGTPLALSVGFTAEAKIDVTVDIVAFYTKMPERERTAYRTWDDPDWWERDKGGAPVLWDKPLAYLNDSVEVDGGNPPGLVSDYSELEPWDTPRVRGANYWTVEHYATLLAAVPWLAALDAEGELSDEEKDEIESRIPGPADVPLFPMEAAS